MYFIRTLTSMTLITIPNKITLLKQKSQYKTLKKITKNDYYVKGKD